MQKIKFLPPADLGSNFQAVKEIKIAKEILQISLISCKFMMALLGC